MRKAISEIGKDGIFRLHPQRDYGLRRILHSFSSAVLSSIRFFMEVRAVVKYGILQAKRSAYSIPLLFYWLHLCEIKSTQRLIGKELNN